jgi:predicted transcriptional regulator
VYDCSREWEKLTMVALTQPLGFDFAAASPESARTAIREALADDPKAGRRVYAALAHKVWSLLVERRFDAEIRDWHGLLHQVKARIRSDDLAAAERVTALADLLRESISLSETSPAREVARRPNARRILEMLAKADCLVPRRRLLDTLGMRSANLSNVLTLLLAHNLIERRDKGKEAEFRLTRFGRQLLESEEKSAAKSVPQELAYDVDLLSKLLATGTHDKRRENAWFEQGLQLTSMALPKGLHGTISIDDLMEDPVASQASTSRSYISGSRGSAPVYIGFRHGRIAPVTPLFPTR